MSLETAPMATLTVDRELKSPNRWQGRHWRYKHRETQEWEQAIFYEIARQRGVKGVVGALLALGAFPWQQCAEKRRVQVIREVPSGRNFIRDEDNLRFATKPLNDALKRLKLIRDDSRKWLEQTTPEQRIAKDGKFHTTIVIDEA